MQKTTFFALCLLLPACATTLTPPAGRSAQDGAAPDPSKEATIVSPVTQPTIFETPAIESTIRPFFMYHEFPQTGLLGGGDLQVYALQIRYAINEKLAFIATKDGFIDFNPGVTALADRGFADIAAGLKYNFIDNREDGVMVTGGLIFEADTGDHEVLQGRGDGILRPFVTAAYEIDEVNILGSFGWNLPIDSGEDSQTIDYHAHLDYEVTPEFRPLVEFNGMTYIHGGDLGGPFAGVTQGDLINLGTTAVSGNDLFTIGFGARYQLAPNVNIGAAYEVPAGGRKGLIRDRITVDWIIDF